jgi:hypothetical protein
LVSGGVDTHLALFSNPLDKFAHGSIQPIRLSPFGRKQIGNVSAEKRLVMTFNDDRVCLWRLGRSGDAPQTLDNESRNMPLPIAEGSQFVSELKMQNGFHVADAVLSRDGCWLAVIDGNASLRMYAVDEQGLLENFSRQVPDIAQSCRRIIFGADSTRLFVALANGSVHALMLEDTVDVFPMTEMIEAVYDAALITSLAISVDDRFLCVGDVNNMIRIVDLATHCMHSIPRLSDGLHTAVKFVKLADDRTVLFISVSSTGRRTTSLVAYDPENKAVVQINDDAINWMQERKEKILGFEVTMQPTMPNGTPECVLFMWTQKWIGRVPVSALLTKGSKQKAKFTDRYENILLFSVLADSEAVVIERPWMAVVEKMAPALQTKSFGQ